LDSSSIHTQHLPQITIVAEEWIRPSQLMAVPPTGTWQQQQQWQSSPGTYLASAAASHIQSIETVVAVAFFKFSEEVFTAEGAAPAATAAIRALKQRGRKALILQLMHALTRCHSGHSKAPFTRSQCLCHFCMSYAFKRARSVLCCPSELLFLDRNHIVKR
jgi:hypothetical protein